MKKNIFILAWCMLLSGFNARAAEKNTIAQKEMHNLKTLIENIKVTAEKSGEMINKRTNHNLAPSMTHTGGGDVDYYQEVRATFIDYNDVPHELCLVLAAREYPFFYDTEAFADMTITNSFNYNQSMMFNADEGMPLSKKQVNDACREICKDKCRFSWRFIDL